jgi:hypothetical protein
MCFVRTLRCSISVGLLAMDALLLVPGRAAEPDPKIVSYTLPDKIQWRKGANADTATIQGDLSGTWWIGTGTKYDPESTFPAPPGTYVVDRANEPHYDGAKDEECVLEIVGTGPLATTPVEAK